MKIVVSLLLFISIGFNIFFLWRSYQNTIVLTVPDGDSLQLADGRRIRLLGVDAPERGRCGATEAREWLESQVKGQRVVLRDIVTDDYGRQLAVVFLRGQIVNKMLIKEGLAKYSSIGGSYAESMKEASHVAESQKLGVYSEACRPTTPPVGCTIKGNIKNGNHTYHLPGCKNYNQTIIDLSYGDHWFCTEQEAKDAGFKKAAGCY